MQRTTERIAEESVSETGDWNPNNEKASTHPPTHAPTTQVFNIQLAIYGAAIGSVAMLATDGPRLRDGIFQARGGRSRGDRGTFPGICRPTHESARLA